MRKCNREEPNLTTCWICFFYFNLCFLLLLFTERILSIHTGLPQGTLCLCLNVKPKCLCSGKHPDPVHLWMAARQRKLTHPLPEAGHSRGYLQNVWPFYFTSPPPPPLCAIKETGIQTPIKWLIWDISLPSSPSAGINSYSLPQHLVSALLACCAASRESLDWVTKALCKPFVSRSSSHSVFSLEQSRGRSRHTYSFYSIMFMYWRLLTALRLGRARPALALEGLACQNSPAPPQSIKQHTGPPHLGIQHLHSTAISLNIHFYNQHCLTPRRTFSHISCWLPRNAGKVCGSCCLQRQGPTVLGSLGSIGWWKCLDKRKDKLINSSNFSFNKNDYIFPYPNYWSPIPLTVHLSYFFCVHKFRVISQLLHMVAEEYFATLSNSYPS